MTRHERTYSDFWRDTTGIRWPKPVPRDTRHYYAIDQDHIVHRFTSDGDRALFVALGEGTRHKLSSTHKLVRAAYEADAWGDEDG